MPKARKKKLFAVFEAGTGKNPTGLLSKALRKRGGKERLFIGTDKFKEEGQVFNLGKALKKAGIKELPENVHLANECASRVLGDIVPGSINIIFASYVMNNLSKRAECFPEQNFTCKEIFLNIASQALKPGGRIVLVQDKSQLPDYRRIAKIFGLEFFSKEIPDKVAKKSPAKAIRLRSTPRRRLLVLKYYRTSRRAVKKLIKKGVIKTREDFARPVIISLKKPRPGKKERDAMKVVSEAMFNLLNELSRMS